MVKKRPSLRSLQAFEAFARNQSYTKAGVELNVTHSAVIQQVRSLEAFLGIHLVDRTRGSECLTENGQAFAESLTNVFVTMDRSLDRLLEEEKRSPLVITTTPSFASEWLLPRFPQFQRQHPGVDVEINPSFAIQPVDSHPIDIAIRYGRGDWSDGKSRLLISTPFVVVAAKKLIPDSSMMSKAELATLPWLQELGTREVESWLEERGHIIDTRPEVVFLPGGMILPIMRQGGGIACTAKALIEDDLRLEEVTILASEEEENSAQGYYLVRPRGYHRWSSDLFSRWLIDQSNQYCQVINASL